ncbi:ATP-grasp fold amidoligase family protein [Thioalkalivibrio paradoxus]|uniref:ATP-grasp domain-containing protein n=1 Tax=Thioalkalivibrio paradoxus ARh 1 TaxID=713585 RepID=W0DNH9_9GAMM|nr:ATP-grasp fold amidoligase family protein [Thioalkalivibrio paradoxus]AHF00145.1 hypothetical protein THITH_10315 [Thioalkalivibrio paradoxus ARh 1]
MVFRFVRELGHLPQILIPRTYNEKMLWRMILDHNPLFVTFSDKLASKALFQRSCPELRLPAVLWQGDAPQDMPTRFLSEDGVVIKANHGCGFTWFPTLTPPDPQIFRQQAHRWLQTDYSHQLGEWAYRGIRPQLFVEERIRATPPDELVELKVHVFHGRVFYTVVYLREKTGQSLSAIFDADGTRLPVTNSVAASDSARALPSDFALPACYAQAMDAAARVAEGTDYLRVDFFAADDTLFGGELTVYPSAGRMTNSRPECMHALGLAWDIRCSWLLSAPQAGWRGRYARWLRMALERSPSSGHGTRADPLDGCR